MKKQSTSDSAQGAVTGIAVVVALVILVLAVLFGGGSSACQ